MSSRSSKSKRLARSNTANGAQVDHNNRHRPGLLGAPCSSMPRRFSGLAMAGDGLTDWRSRVVSPFSSEAICDMISLCDLGASDGTMTDFGAAPSVFFRDPDGLEAEVMWNKAPETRAAGSRP